jgi:hypothetical protein
MMTKWRVIKGSTLERYDYIGIEFDMDEAAMKGVRVYNRDTGVRKRTTSQFEVLDENKWEVISNGDTHGLMKTFNNYRRARGKNPVTEQDVLALLYRIERLK